MLRNSVRRIVVGLVVSFSASSSPAQTTLYVDADATGANDGSSWCNAFADLQNALFWANASAGTVTEVRVAGGSYRPISGPYLNTAQRRATFRLVDGVALLGGFAGCGASNPNDRNIALYETTLSGDLLGNDGSNFANYAENSIQIVTYDDPAAQSVVLDGFTIAGGNADGAHAEALDQGSAIHIRGGTTKCIPGGPTIRNCIIRDNRANHHGAVNDHGLGTVIENCTFRDNFSGEEGAGLLIHSGPTQVTNCQFIDNVVDGEGGGAWSSHDNDVSCASAASAPTFTGCTFRGNRAISGDGSFRGQGGGLFAEFNRPTVDNCVFENNEAADRGGGLFADQATVVLRDSTVRDNTAPGIVGHLGSGNGGGVWLGPRQTGQSVESIVLRTLFSGNFADHYGGGLTLQSNNARVEQCSFTANTVVGRGGGIRVSLGEPRIVRCTFEANQTSAYGGGLSVEGGAPARVLVWNSVFRRNRAILGSGGALFVFNAEAIVGNCLFVDNFASSRGGALCSHVGDTQFINSTFYANTGPGIDGPGLGSGSLAAFESFNQLSPGQATFQNCVVWDVMPLFWNMDASVIAMNHCDVQGGWSGTGNFAADPRFADAAGPDNIIGTADDDLGLCAVSPAIDAGSNAALPSDIADVDGDGNTAEIIPVDLNGVARIGGPVVDIGAYEGAHDSATCDGPFCLYGDANSSGQINFLDISSIVQVFMNASAPITFEDADIYPCGGDAIVNFLDISADVKAFQGSPQCPNVCNPPNAPRISP